jgi:hypothetical protein
MATLTKKDLLEAIKDMPDDAEIRTDWNEEINDVIFIPDENTIFFY